MVVTPGVLDADNAAHLSGSMARFVAPRNRQRKRRTIFSPAATRVLQQQFADDCYPDNARLQQLGQLIGHSDIAAIQVNTGFQSPAPFPITEMKLRTAGKRFLGYACALGQHTAKRREKCTKQSRSCL